MFGNYGAGSDVPGQLDAYALYDAAYNWLFPSATPTYSTSSQMSREGEPAPVYDWRQPQSIPAESTPWTPAPKPAFKPTPTVPAKPVPQYVAPNYDAQFAAIAAQQAAAAAQQDALMRRLAEAQTTTSAASTNTRVIVASAVGVGALLLLLRVAR